MIRKQKSGIAVTAAAVLLMLCGCATTPFAPVAVPNNSTVRPTGIKPDIAKVNAELRMLQKVKAPDYVLKPGDTFNLVIHGVPNLSISGQGQNQNAETKPVPMMVMPNGAISMAPVGYVKVGGLTVPQATALLQKHYRKYVRNCTITLQPEKVTPDSFAIGGAVQAPGVYPFVFGSFRLTDAVATAKGFLSINNSVGERYELADLENAYIVRNNRILPVDFTEALLKRNPLHNIPIIDGDSIMIPSLESGKVTVLGETTRQNCIPYQPNLTLLQAIAYCGGLKTTNSRDVKVIRGGLKHPVVYTLDIRDIRYGRVMDFPLKPRDIVFVPRDAITEWNVLITQILPTIQVLNGLAGPFGSPSSLLYK